MNFVNFILVLAGVLLNAAAQLCIKQGMNIIGNISLDTGAVLAMILRAATNPYIIAGLTCYVISVLVWMVVLSKVEVSLAYPFLSIGYIVTAFVGYFFMGETLGLYKILGIVTICAGIGIMFKA
ncbi:4-amino-4-deoxy-L-arabinose transferase [Selenomonas sp. AE3005]|uniref:4-amino-4-deoxy-L-arabinose transferase n=1 Tax=Selenomonas sp. AE3005 TaxID=1485543 RepID=UPI00048A3E08|nr:4-amino-4-deoxy-L-arabinose transferase [Selenomonas sp. AE3005]